MLKCYILTSIIALSQATSVLKAFADAAHASLDVRPGMTLQVLQWMPLGCMFLFAAAVADMLKVIGRGTSASKSLAPPMAMPAGVPDSIPTLGSGPVPVF